jgi:hypothetical protein
LNNSIPQKQCSRCKDFYPPTTEHFHANKKREDGLSVWCKICANTNRKRLFKECPEVRQAYKERNRKRIQDYDNEYYATHPDRQEAQRKRATDNRNNNLELERERSREYGRTHVKEIVARNKEWAKNNPERYRAIMVNRYAREKNAEGSHTEQDLNEIYERLGGKCAYCGVPIFWDVFRDVNVDHIRPLSKGGTNWPDNITLACKSCNCSKNDSLLEDWLLKRGW